MKNVLPPPVMPANQSAGYLGFYCATYLPIVFDLVDVDGTNPVNWMFYKVSKKQFRFIEEKPGVQKLHKSQHRTLKALASLIVCGIEQCTVNSNSGVYVIYEADKLLNADFPIIVERIYADRESRTQSMKQNEFDNWLLQYLEVQV